MESLGEKEGDSAVVARGGREGGREGIVGGAERDEMKLGVAAVNIAKVPRYPI